MTACARPLDYLYRPKKEFDKRLKEHVWVMEAWEWIIRRALGVPCTEPSWFTVPAMMRIAITTPEVMKALHARQRGRPYPARVKPFNFVLSPLIDPDGGCPVGTTRDEFTLIAPFTPDASSWLDWNGSICLTRTARPPLARPGYRLPTEAEAKTYGDIVSQYRWHAEAKSLAPDGGPCAADSAGLLGRVPVLAAQEFRSIGKETDRRWEREDDMSLLNPRLVEYRQQESARLVVDPALSHHARRHSIRALAKAAQVSEKTVKSARRGDRIRKATAQRLEKGLRTLARR